MIPSLRRIAPLLCLCVAVAGASRQHLKHEFFIYDVSSADTIAGAVVTVSHPGGSQQVETSRRGSVTLRLPTELLSADVSVEAPGYCSTSEVVQLDGRPHVGGQAFWIGLQPCNAAGGVTAGQ